MEFDETASVQRRRLLYHLRGIRASLTQLQPEFHAADPVFAVCVSCSLASFNLVRLTLILHIKIKINLRPFGKFDAIPGP
jgi:hypothetical protein